MLDCFGSEGEIGILIFDNIQSLICKIMTQVLCWLRLAHGIKINQATFLPVKDLGLFLCAFLRAGMATVNFDDIEVSSAPLEDAARLDRFHQLIAVSESFLEEYERSYMSVNRQRVALFEALELFILVLHAWTKIKVRELHDIMFVLEHFLPAHKILKLQ